MEVIGNKPQIPYRKIAISHFMNLYKLYEPYAT